MRGSGSGKSKSGKSNRGSRGDKAVKLSTSSDRDDIRRYTVQENKTLDVESTSNDEESEMVIELPSETTLESRNMTISTTAAEEEKLVIETQVAKSPMSMSALTFPESWVVSSFDG